MPNDMAVLVHPAHYKQNPIWHQTLDTEYTQHIPLTQRDTVLLLKACVVMHLTDLITKGRNITMDNFFTSLTPANKIIANKKSLLRKTIK